MTEERKAELWRERAYQLKEMIKELEMEISTLKVEKQMLINKNEKLRKELKKFTNEQTK